MAILQITVIIDIHNISFAASLTAGWVYQAFNRRLLDIVKKHSGISISAALEKQNNQKIKNQQSKTCNENEWKKKKKDDSV